MSDISPYPKIFTLGSGFVPNLFTGSVEVTEKIDGSMFAFGVTAQRRIVMRSKGKELFSGACEKMFQAAADHVDSVVDRLLDIQAPEGIIFYGEYLKSVHHNILTYGRIPTNHIMVFGVLKGDVWVNDHDEIRRLADLVLLETVPLLHRGSAVSASDLAAFFERDSVLGAEKLEGVVIKNYAHAVMVGNQVMPSFAKYVRAEFKERHAGEWGPRFSEANKFDVWLESFRTDARWQKAVQHLRDAGVLLNEPRDIGILMKELERDLLSEERANIERELFGMFRDQIVRKARAGFPEWYKEQLVKTVVFPCEV